MGTPVTKKEKKVSAHDTETVGNRVNVPSIALTLLLHHEPRWEHHLPIACIPDPTFSKEKHHRT